MVRTQCAGAIVPVMAIASLTSSHDLLLQVTSSLYFLHSIHSGTADFIYWQYLYKLFWGKL